MISLISFAPAAQAASSNGTITITPTTGTPSYICADQICDFQTLVTVTGAGFPSGQNDIDVCFVSTTQAAAVGCTNGIDLGTSGNLFDQTIAGAGDTVQADANGNFKVQFYAPIAYGGTYNVYAYYTPTSGVPVMTSVAVFTLTAAMAVEDQTTLKNSGIPGQAFDVIVVGMGAQSAALGEGIQLIPSSFFTGVWTALEVGHILGVDQGVFEEDDGGVVTGSATAIGAATLPTLPSGSIALEALGLTTGTIATTTFTTTPSITLTAYNPTCSLGSILSIPTAAGNKFCMAGVGFAKSSTIAAPGSVTVGGASTIESAITTTSTGAFGPIPVTLSSGTSVGPLTIAFDGMTFNYVSGNIEAPGILIGSNAGQGALTYMYDSTSASSTSGNVGDTVHIFGFGYCTTAVGNTATGCATDTVTPAFKFNGVAAGAITIAVDANGAFEWTFTVPALPTTTAACIAATAICYTVHDAEISDTNTAPDQTFNILPQATFGGYVAEGSTTAGTAGTAVFVTSGIFSASMVGDYLTITTGASAGETSTIAAFVTTDHVTTAGALANSLFEDFIVWSNQLGSPVGVYNSYGYGQYLEVSGFASTTDSNTITITMNGVSWVTSPQVVATANGETTVVNANGNPTLLWLPVIGATPSTDFPGGSYNVNASGTTTGNWAKTTNTLTILPIQAEAAGVAGATISALSINYGNAGQSVALLSSPHGGLHGLAPSTAYTIMWDGTAKVGSFTSTPAGEVPVGVSFVVPTGTAGFHIVDIQAAGTSAIYGNQLTGGQQFGGCGNTCDLIFHLLPLLTATPSLVGANENATVVGNGLPSNTLLYVVAPNSVSYASFTSTSTGAVPANTMFEVPAQPTFTSCGVNCYDAGGELGTLISWNINNAQSNQVGVMQYVYGTTASLSASSGSAGASVTITANGLNAPVGGNVFTSDSPYDVVFNCVPSAIIPVTCAGLSSGATPANIIIGALIPNTLGAASTTITIPASATSGTYVIQIVSTVAGTWDLAIPVTFTVGAPSGVGDTTLTPGSPSQGTLNLEPDVALTYTNTLTSSSINVIGYAVVTNGLGQVVLYTTSEATLQASGSQTLYFVLAGLPAATYTVTMYALSSQGLVVSQTSTSTAVIS